MHVNSYFICFVFILILFALFYVMLEEFRRQYILLNDSLEDTANSSDSSSDSNEANEDDIMIEDNI